MSALPAVTLLTDDELDRLIGAGDPRVRGRVELRRGALRRTSAEHIPHARMTARIRRALEDAVAASGLPLEVLGGGSVKLGGGFAPRPDAVVWSPTKSDGMIPGSDVKPCVECADSTRSDDLGDKQRGLRQSGPARVLGRRPSEADDPPLQRAHRRRLFPPRGHRGGS